MDEFELLKRLVSIKSPFGEEHEISEFIASLLEENGIPVETVPVEGFGDDVVAYLKGKGPTVVLNGHMDTVHLSQGWTKNPWGELDGDRFYGLGSADMKGGLAALLSAFLELSELPKNERPNVIFTAVSDEEGFSRGSWELIKSGRLDKADLVLVGEPTNEKLMLGARGRFVIEVGAKGKKAHAARPYLGINAIEELAKLVSNLNRIRMKKHPKLGKGSYCTLYFSGSADGLSVPDEAIAIIDRHVVVGEDWEKVRGELYRLAERVGVRAELEIEKYRRPTPEMLPYVVKENNRFVRRFKEAYREVERKSVEITYGASVGDFNYFGTYLSKPTLVFGPIGGNWHSADEWVSVSSVRRVKGIYLRFLRALAGLR
ncbi:ArgE/DapE-related deacylase [Thermococcus kodakarensis KOD1]|uniref:ArgE/DapE-related deacylase n=1 Tax=Thermococcus kodakarensis (strain ATCC BAA-918 / JCM 12380 / KOD1) TaxID=69014 RepID=Q5JHJ1_THEKO|nr:M20 family metallopeptidase [Thermococcus kodakarensis]WCN28006.1 M20 family metallopeptidase [Thermococcus kodakarensis]WCN30305.1 M20 family metallopeptidase [Thermococcus kodakarensis]BAD86355.1 ArgE/DapE-related deacylase [Thermococcus kodakarensis KOD1]